jgi:Flp pilus assembly protein TadB
VIILSKKKKYSDGVERDERGLTADDRAIIDSIDFKKIGADAVAAHHDEIVASAVATARKKAGESVGKTRRGGVLSLLIGAFLIVGGFLSFGIGVGIFLLIAGILIIIYGICAFSIAKSNKQFSQETPQTMSSTPLPDGGS